VSRLLGRSAPTNHSPKPLARALEAFPGRGGFDSKGGCDMTWAEVQDQCLHHGISLSTA